MVLVLLGGRVLASEQLLQRMDLPIFGILKRKVNAPTISMRYFHSIFSSYFPTLVFLIPLWTNPEDWGNPEGSWTLKLASSMIFIFAVVIVASIENFWKKKKAEGAGKDQFLTRGELFFWVGLFGCALWGMVGVWNKIVACAAIVLYQLLCFFLFRQNQKMQKETSMKEQPSHDAF